MTKTTSLTNARKDIYNIAEEVADGSTYYTFTENGEGKVVLMSLEEFESWQETLDILQAGSTILDDRKSANQDLRKGETTKLDDLV